MHRRGIAAAGNWIIDTVKMIDVYPKEERLAIIDGEARGTGGAPYNVLVGLAALDPDLPLEAIGVVGDDENGQFILEHLKSLNIATRQMRVTADAPTSYTDVMTVRSTGRRTFFHNRGANALLCADDFDFEPLRARIFHLGYLMLLDALDVPDPHDRSRSCGAAVLERASQAGLITTVDIVTDLGERLNSVVKPALRFADYFIANELETAAVAGVRVRDDNDRLLRENLPRVADELLRLGVRRGVVIHAPEGAYWRSTDGYELFMPSLDVPAEWIKGAAGAGDAFCGGVLYGIHEGLDAEECLKLGSAHAAMCLSDPTTTAGLKPLAETMALVQRFGFR